MQAKLFIITLAFLLVGFTTENDNPTVLMPKVKREHNLDFKVDAQSLQEQNVQLYVALLDKSQRPMAVTGSGSLLNFKEDFLPFDVFEYWKKRKVGEKYFILMTKVAYLIPSDSRFFSPEKLADVGYLRKTMPEYKIDKIGEHRFKIDCGFMAPDFEYELDFLDTDSLQHPILRQVEKLSPDLKRPQTAVLQHNYGYSRVLLHKTSKMSVSVSLYYPYGEGSTLAVNYTLNYIHELPPNFLGGANLLLKEIEKGICGHIAQTRKTVLQEQVHLGR